MGKKLSMANGSGQRWFSDAIGGAWRIVKHGTKIHGAVSASFYDELCARFRYGWDGDVVIVLWVHDELVACCRPEIAEQVG